jgi:FkbM family methyltransferase
MSLIDAISAPFGAGRAQSRDLIAEIEKYQICRGGAHRAGTLTTGPLRAIEHYLKDYFQGRPVNTVETGCGASTILFAEYSHRHVTFCFDDRASSNSSVDFAESFPGFKSHRVEWVFGPTQRTVLNHTLRDPVDLILLDGPHGFPFPEIEYFALYPWLKPEGVLILDDIHIPTIGHLFDFLSQDDMFYPAQVVGSTAFFVRSQAPALARDGDDWWLQRYNIQRFPAYRCRAPKAAFHVPFSISYADAHLSQLDDHYVRGFVPIDGRPTTEGAMAMLRLPLDKAPSGKTNVEIELECIAPRQQPEAGFEAFVNSVSLGRRTFAQGGQVRLSAALDPWSHPVLEIKFYLWRQKTADKLEGFAAGSFDQRRLGLTLRKIAVRPVVGIPAIVAEDITTRQGSVVSFKCESSTVSFFVDDPRDPVQAHHEAGRFWEWDELSMLRRHVSAGVGVLDVGANVGNHTVFFERILGASSVVPIEPLPRNVAVLRLNAALNRLTRTDLGYLGVALGPAPGSGAAHVLNAGDNGGAVQRDDPSADIPIEQGDRLLQGLGFGLVRIGVAGREIEVLQGLEETIRRSRPVLLVQLEDSNRQRAETLLDRWGYRVADAHRPQDTTTTLVLKHRAR